MKTISCIMLLALIGILVCPSVAQQTESEKFIVRISGINKADTGSAEWAGIRLMWHDRLPEAQAIMTRKQADRLISKGMDISVLYPAPVTVDPEYHTLDEMWTHIDSLALQYPDLLIIDTLGFSHQNQLPIPMIKISDNPAIDEDEAVIYYDGMHHAREPIGMEICLKIMDYLLSGYSSDPRVKKWVDDAEIYIVPCLNPDGWKYVVDSSLNDPWWRKNLADNNGNGSFDPGFDGVDLNRNYDFWWEYGEPSPSNELYRGPEPFSEPEIIGKRDFMLSRKPVVSLTYHSYGEYVGYVRYLGYTSAPDWPVMYTIANQIAALIPKINGGTYGTGNIAGDESQSPNWCYQAAGTIEILIETADVLIPSGPAGQQVADDNLAGALYLLERAFQSGITGHALNGETGGPLQATIEIVGTDNDQIEPRTCDSLYGRFTRLLLPGTYTVRAFAGNTDTVTVENVVVTEDTLTVVDFELFPPESIEEQAFQNSSSDLCIKMHIYPNPAERTATFEYLLKNEASVILTIYNNCGQAIEEPLNERQGKGEHRLCWNSGNLAPGLFFYRLSIQGSPDLGQTIGLQQNVIGKLMIAR